MARLPAVNFAGGAEGLVAGAAAAGGVAGARAYCAGQGASRSPLRSFPSWTEVNGFTHDPAVAPSRLKQLCCHAVHGT